MAKPKLGLRRFDDDCSNTIIEKSFSNKTKICRSASMITINCEFCGLSFSRKASEVKRKNKSYCSMACVGADRRREISVECRTCKKPFKVRQSSYKRVTCCSDECKRVALSESRTIYNLQEWKLGRFDTIKGSGSPRSKLDNETRIKIATEDGVHSVIAKKYGITRSQVSKIKKAHRCNSLSPLAGDAPPYCYS